jgi:hypothetical protein
MRRVLRGLGLLAGLLAVSCAVPPGTDSGSTADAITREEIDRGQWADAYDLVSTLRPRWVRGRGPDSFANPGQVQVYVDGTRLGDVELLRSLPTVAIERVEWVDPVSSAARWGLDHAHGVILITYGREGAIRSAPDVSAEPGRLLPSNRPGLRRGPAATHFSTHT